MSWMSRLWPFTRPTSPPRPPPISPVNGERDMRINALRRHQERVIETLLANLDPEARRQITQLMNDRRLREIEHDGC